METIRKIIESDDLRAANNPLKYVEECIINEIISGYQRQQRELDLKLGELKMNLFRRVCNAANEMRNNDQEFDVKYRNKDPDTMAKLNEKIKEDKERFEEFADVYKKESKPLKDAIDECMAMLDPK